MIKALAFIDKPPKPSTVHYLVLSGAEEFLRAEARSVFMAALGQDADLIEIEWREDDKDRDAVLVFDELRTLSLFSPSKAVLVRGAKLFVKEHQKALTAFLESEVPVATLILDDEALFNKKGKKVTMPKALSAMEYKGGVIVDCSSLYARPFGYGKPEWDSELTRWVCMRVKKAGKSIEPQVAYQLHRRESSGLRGLMAQIDKLVVHAGGATEITQAAVDELVGGDEEANVFEAIEAFAERDRGKAVGNLRRLFEQGVTNARGAKSLDRREISLRFTAILASRMRELGAITEKTLGGSSFEDAAQKVVGAGRKWLFPKYQSQMRARHPRELGNAILGLADLDYALKTSGGDPYDLLVRFVVEHTTDTAPGRPNPFMRSRS